MQERKIFTQTLKESKGGRWWQELEFWKLFEVLCFIFNLFSGNFELSIIIYVYFNIETMFQIIYLQIKWMPHKNTLFLPYALGYMLTSLENPQCNKLTKDKVQAS